MKIKALKLVTLAFLVLACALPVLFLSGKASSEPDPSLAGLGFGSVEAFNSNYKAWEAEYSKTAGTKIWSWPWAGSRVFQPAIPTPVA